MNDTSRWKGWNIAGGVLGAVAGVPLTVASFFYFLGARLGPTYNGQGESGLLLLWVLPIAPLWGFLTGGFLVSFANWYAASTSERCGGGAEWSRGIPRWVHGAVTVLASPLLFGGGCAVLGWVLGCIWQVVGHL